jgi:GTP pyrophosphokinase
MLTSDNLTTIARDLHLADVASLYAAVGENAVSAQSVVQKLVAGFGGEEGAVEDIAETAVATRPPRNRTTSQDPGVVVKDVSDVWVKLARCCTPVPGDAVFGFVTRSGGVSVHREDCANAEDLREQSERVVEVSWKPTSASTFLVAIQVEALDRHKLLADVTRVLSEERVNILSATVTTTRDRVAVSRFTFEMADPKHLGHLVAAVRKVDGVFDAYRVTSGAGNKGRARWARPSQVRAGYAAAIVSVLMSTSVFGWPSPWPLALSVPALAAVFTRSRPAVSLPSTVYSAGSEAAGMSSYTMKN